MLNSITRFFDNHFKEKDDNADGYDPQKLHLASAALLIELSKADQDIADTEIATLMTILRARFDLSQANLDELLDLAEQEAREATSLYQFTSLINEHFDYMEKVQLILNMWEVAYADSRIDRYEEHLIRKVADLLYISHVDFIRMKHKARETVRE